MAKDHPSTDNWYFWLDAFYRGYGVRETKRIAKAKLKGTTPYEQDSLLRQFDEDQ